MKAHVATVVLLLYINTLSAEEVSKSTLSAKELPESTFKSENLPESTSTDDELPESLLQPPSSVISQLPESVRNLVGQYEDEYIQTVKRIGRDLMTDATTLQPALKQAKQPVLVHVKQPMLLHQKQPVLMKVIHHHRKPMEDKTPASKKLRKQPDNLRSPTYFHPQLIGGYEPHGYGEPEVHHHTVPEVHHYTIPHHVAHESPVHLYEAPEKHKPEVHLYGEPEKHKPEVHLYGEPIKHKPEVHLYGEPVKHKPEVHLYGEPEKHNQEVHLYGEPEKHKPEVHLYGEPEKHKPEAPKKPVKYNFAWGVKDVKGNDYGHWEKSDGDKINGEYNVILPDGRRQIVTYSADKKSGFKSNVKYEGKAHPHVPAPKPKPVKSQQVQELHVQEPQHKPFYHHEYHIEQHKPIYHPVQHKPVYQDFPHAQNLFEKEHFIKSKQVIEQHTQHQEQPKAPVSVHQGDTTLVDYSGDYEGWEEQKPEVQEYPTFQVPEGFNLFDDILQDRTNENGKESKSSEFHQGNENTQATFYTADADSSSTDNSGTTETSSEKPQYLYPSDADGKSAESGSASETKEKAVPSSKYPKKVVNSYIHTTVDDTNEHGTTTPRIRLLEVDPSSFERIARTNKGKMYDSNVLLNDSGDVGGLVVEEKPIETEERSSSSQTMFPHRYETRNVTRSS